MARGIPECPKGIVGTVFLRARNGALLSASSENPQFQYCDPQQQKSHRDLPKDVLMCTLAEHIARCEAEPSPCRRVPIILDTMNVLVQNTWFLDTFPAFRITALEKLDELEESRLFVWGDWFRAQLG
jgi:hypothetical protein